MYLILTNDVNILKLARESKQTQILNLSEFENKITPSVNIDTTIIEFLSKEIGIKLGISGFTYIKDFLNRCVERNTFYCKTNYSEVYEYIAKPYNKSSHTIAHSIKRAIDSAYIDGYRTDTFKKLFGTKSPSTSKFLKSIALYFKTNYVEY